MLCPQAVGAGLPTPLLGAVHGDFLPKRASVPESVGPWLVNTSPERSVAELAKVGQVVKKVKSVFVFSAGLPEHLLGHPSAEQSCFSHHGTTVSW